MDHDTETRPNVCPECAGLHEDSAPHYCSLPETLSSARPGAAGVKLDVVTGSANCNLARAVDAYLRARHAEHVASEAIDEEEWTRGHGPRVRAWRAALEAVGQAVLDLESTFMAYEAMRKPR